VTVESHDTTNNAQGNGVSRRSFMARSMLAAAIAAVAPSLLLKSNTAQAAIPDELIAETMNGVLAFVVPGGDAFSLQQQLTHATPGGVEAGATLPLIFGLNVAAPAPPGFASLSEALTYILNTVAGFIPSQADANPAMTSAFSKLTFAEKTMLFTMMDDPDPTSPLQGQFVGLSGPLIIFAGMMTYSEAPVLNPMTGELVTTPVGWTISSYEGVSNGRRDFQGYYKGRRAASWW